MNESVPEGWRVLEPGEVLRKTDIEWHVSAIRCPVEPLGASLARPGTAVVGPGPYRYLRRIDRPPEYEQALDCIDRLLASVVRLSETRAAELREIQTVAREVRAVIQQNQKP